MGDNKCYKKINLMTLRSRESFHAFITIDVSKVVAVQQRTDRGCRVYLIGQDEGIGVHDDYDEIVRRVWEHAFPEGL